MGSCLSIPHILKKSENIKTEWDENEIKIAYYYSEFQKPFSYKAS
jgi:hypothetical protein